MGADAALALVDTAVRELTLFAAVGFVVGGLDDLAIDLLWLWRTGRRRLARFPRATLADWGTPVAPKRFAIFVPAWDESAVIGRMLASALRRIDHPDYRIFAGAYPNDPATIAAIDAVAAGDPRLHRVLVPHPGPTSKADCLNALWRAMRAHEQASGRAFDAVVLHDAEDVVHAGSLQVFERLVGRFAAVQLPVLPLVDRGSRWVSAHYADEFAESHAKALVVREALGAAMPLAGVGCAIARPVLAAIAQARGGDPFDRDSLTEDYELGLHVAAAGGRTILARVPEASGGPPVATRAHFPATLGSAVRQKARWMVGIALAGWDRTGWGVARSPAEWWMRMRDRRAPLAVLVLAVGYLAIVGWSAALLLHALAGTPAATVDPGLRLLLFVNSALLVWRLVMRGCFTAAAYGWREGVRAVPRAAVANLVAILAAQRAVRCYLRLLRDGHLGWDKTAHSFPAEA